MSDPHDPNNWQAWLEYLPNIGAAFLTFSLAMTRHLRDGGPALQAFLNSLTCTLLASGLFPFFVDIAEHYGLSQQAAFAPCVFLAVMGVDWLRAKADDIYDLVVGWLRR